MSDRPGYEDTPTLPNAPYRVHDPDRPHPPAVDPGGSIEKTPPSDATVLLDGGGLEGWEHRNGKPADWNVTDGYVEVEPGTGDIRTRAAIGDCQLHVEWAAPENPVENSQARGNSGVFLMDRYEIQVLDCYENPTYADGYTGAVYGQHPPLANACREPGAWESYDITWRGPRFDDDGGLLRPGQVTVLHNGVLIQETVELIGATTHRAVAEYNPHPPEAPLRLQDHGDRVRFRNVWYRSLG